MATENATTTENTTRFNAMNDAEKALRELHALGDLLLHVDGQELTQETTATLGEMLDGIGSRLQVSLDVLWGTPEPVKA